MALPLIPIAIATGAIVLARKVEISAVDQRVEDRHDALPEGLAAHRDKNGEQINSSYRWKRVVRIGQSGPGLEIDASVLGRLKFKKVK